MCTYIYIYIYAVCIILNVSTGQYHVQLCFPQLPPAGLERDDAGDNNNNKLSISNSFENTVIF